MISHTIAKQFSDLEERKNIDITQLNQDLHEKSREIEVLHKTDNTKDDAIEHCQISYKI